MPAIIASNGVQVSITGSYGTRTWANVVAGLVTGGGTATGLATDIVNSYIENILPVLASSVNLSGARYVDLETLDGPSGPVPDVVGMPANGGGGDNGCPPNVAYLVHLEVPGGRSSRNGRMYLPGVNEGETTGTGVIDSDQVDGMNIALGAFKADILAGDNGDLGVLGKLSDGSYQVRSVAGISCDSKVATQRRRLRK